MTSPIPSSRVSSEHPLYIAGVVAVVVALIMLPYAFFSRQTLQRYAREGVTAEATVLEKERTRAARGMSSPRVRVSFFTKSILEGGELVMTTIDEFVSGPLWDSLDEQDSVEVLYLPDDPENQVILKASLDGAYFPPIQRYDMALALFALGVALIWWGKRSRSPG